MAETKQSDTERATARNDNVYMKLYYIQSKLKVGKNRDFDCHGRKYAYRNADDILTAVKPLLAETKTVLLTPAEAVFKEGGFTRKDATNEGRWYMKATAILMDINTKETVECSREAREPENKPGMDDTQVSGSAISYALKYALAGLFALDDGQNDPDEGTPEEKKEMQKEDWETKHYQLIDKFKGMAKQKKVDPEDMAMKLFFKRLSELSENSLVELTKRFDAAFKKYASLLKDSEEEIPLGDKK